MSKGLSRRLMVRDYIKTDGSGHTDLEAIELDMVVSALMFGSVTIVGLQGNERTHALSEWPNLYLLGDMPPGETSEG